MKRTAQQLLAEALVLPENDRAELAAELLDSLDAQNDSDSEALWAAEISSRIAALDAGAVQTISWKEARRRVLRGGDGADPS